MTTQQTYRSAVIGGTIQGAVLLAALIVGGVVSQWVRTPAPEPAPAPVVVPVEIESWHALHDGEVTDAPEAIALAKVGSKYNGTIEVVGYPKIGKPVRWLVSVTGGPLPPPPPPDPNPPEPQPPTPIPSTEFRVLIVEEKDDRGTIPPDQLAALFSTQVREYLNRKCAKGADGKTPEWRFWDDDVVLSAESETWQKIWTATKPQLTKLPALVVIKGTEGKVLDYPANEAAALAMLKQYGGD